jgi:hypothetical protein
MRRIMAILILVLLLAGCKKDDSVPYEDQYKKGEDGLVFDFIKGAPPEKVYEDSDFAVGITLRNKGGYNIRQGMLNLNLEPDYMEALGSSQNYDLDGKSLYSPNGAFLTQDIKVHAKNIDTMSERHKSTIIATACYKYAAETVQNVCIDADVLQIRPTKKVCETKDITLTSQGGPIVITKIEQRTIPKGDNKIEEEFTINIANKGKGTPADMYAINTACGSKDPTLRPNYWNLVHLSKLKMSSLWVYNGNDVESMIKCRPNPVKLENNEGKIVCTTQEFTPDSSYITQLQVLLEYGYVESKTAVVEIMRKA